MRDALAAVGVAVDASRADEAHHCAIGALDGLGAWPAYTTAYCVALGAPVASLRVALPAVQAAFEGPSDAVWNEERADARSGLEALAALGVPLVITSNSDGRVETLIADQLTLCQVGPGAGVEMTAILDSAVLGVAKPDPGIFEAAVAAVGCEPDEVLHVGDTVSIDVVGAAGAGLVPLHLDPFRLCTDASHLHAQGVAEVADVVRRLGA
jgi:putative hydrolase of the HAD superfamily